MGMFRIKCKNCDYTTIPHYLSSDCVKEKQRAHERGRCEQGYNAFDSALGNMCPKCGGTTVEEYRYFSDDEIKAIKAKNER